MPNFDVMLYSLPAALIGLTVHEFAHAWVATKLGDPTPMLQGRLTLNPVKHIDPIGFLFIVIAGFGWAKPVQFDPRALKNPRRDHALIAAAGPFSNLLLGLAALICARIFIAGTDDASSGRVVFTFLMYFGYINLGLFVFNMLPLPPLDGSHIVLQWIQLKPETEAAIMKYGMLALFGIFILESQTKIDLLPIGKITGWMGRLILGI